MITYKHRLKPADLDGLRKLKQDVDAAVQNVYDWVGPLNSNSLYVELNEFQVKISNAIQDLESQQ